MNNRNRKRVEKELLGLHLECPDCKDIALAIAVCLDEEDTIPPVSFVSAMTRLPKDIVSAHYVDFAIKGWLTERAIHLMDLKD